MGEVRNIDSAPDPRRKAGEGDAVNPDKFQKALKVEKADETDKREKRNRPRKEEELDDEQDEVGASIPVPHGLFKEYMSEEEKKASALEDGEGTAVTFVSEGKGSAAGTSKGLGFVPEVNEEGASPSISVGVGENVSSRANPIEAEENDLMAQPLESAKGPLQDTNTGSAPPPSSDVPEQGYFEQVEMPEKSDTQRVDQSSKSDSSHKTKKKKKAEKKKHAYKTKNPKKEASEQGKEVKGKKANTGKPPKTDQPVDSASAKQKKSAKKQANSKQATQKTVLSSKTTKEDRAKSGKKVSTSTIGKLEEKKAEKVSEKEHAPLSAPKEVQEHTSDHTGNEQSKEEEMVVDAGPTATASPTGIAALQMSPFANIPKDVFTLFEKMVGMMQVSKDNGKSITTVKLNMPNSVFDKCELVLEHYDTAPNNYTVQFLGNPQAVQRFSDNLPRLNNAIAESKLSFSIHLPPPKLSKTYSSAIPSLEKEKGDKDEENDREEKER